jgi:hypothetical protein
MARDRAQAITLDYTLGIAIAVILITGLLIAGGNFIADQRDTAARSELRVIGQQLATDIEAADRLISAAGNDGSVRVRRNLPTAVSGSQYDIELVEESNPYLVLTSSDPDLSISVEFTNFTAVRGADIGSGSIAITYSSGALTLEEGGES